MEIKLLSRTTEATRRKQASKSKASLGSRKSGKLQDAGNVCAGSDGYRWGIGLFVTSLLRGVDVAGRVVVEWLDDALGIFLSRLCSNPYESRLRIGRPDIKQDELSC